MSKGPKWSASGAPAYAEATARQATQENRLPRFSVAAKESRK